MNRYFGLHTLEGEWHSLLPRYTLLADRVRGKRVLDIGCGTGIGSSMLLELGATAVDAIDHRPAVLELGRMKHAKEGLDFHVMFWEELDFPEDTFDIVICLDPSSPVTDPSLIMEVRRVLKAQGEYICAVETKPLPGLESVLPRYGYTESGENVDVHETSDRVPQLGQLNDAFAFVDSVLQKPVISYIFDRASEPDRITTAVRKLDESRESGTWIQEEGSSEDQGRWVSLEMGLATHETEIGSVEIFFCSNTEAPAPPLREVHLPYYSIVERLRQIFGDLQVMGVSEAEQASMFNEVLDSGEAEESVERHPTSEYASVNWDRAQTNVRSRPEYPPANDEVDELHARVVELSDLYTQVRSDFQQVVGDAHTALEERDQYIAHLVDRVQRWESQFFSRTPETLEEQTGEFHAIHTPDRVGELEAELARLQDVQRRLKAELDEKEKLENALSDDNEVNSTASEEE